VALRLKRNGVTRIRPLQGGLNVWVSREFPVEDLKQQVIEMRRA